MEDSIVLSLNVASGKCCLFSGISYVTLQEDSEVLSHLLEALEFGAPPHGGIALGKCSVVLQNAGVL